MYRFWESMLLGAGSYRGAPFPKHAVLPVQQAPFERWLTLFVAEVNENFSGPKSEEAKDARYALLTRLRDAWAC